ncbi:hypothetical protein [Pseudomonas rubra]|uniref:Uncharacterized protein n=1 Tax=Pseudomonas rubra TaxID=2942627 RepID=A0ABT5P728_9PSED|nr:hypothetical protein [Pseudomonas rubra]MDD1014097.1 hypothetical protein [Pseudomonas rubra]MDD1039031.1 hypothetical protein [Pseudomonas rubra]MDD1154215.1 hypothetical protein [Pseudomonas rubra]
MDDDDRFETLAIIAAPAQLPKVFCRLIETIVDVKWRRGAGSAIITHIDWQDGQEQL